MVIDTGGLKKGIVIEHEGALLRVMEYQHIKTARGSATIKITVRNLRTGATTEKSFQNGTRFTVAELDRRTVQFLYKDEDGNYVFMDIDSYEQPVLSPETLGNVVNYIRENDTVDMQTFDGEPIDVIIPTTVVLKVVQTEPGIKGDTATGAVKPATLETGLVVNVPLFVNRGRFAEGRYADEQLYRASKRMSDEYDRTSSGLPTGLTDDIAALAAVMTEHGLGRFRSTSMASASSSVRRPSTPVAGQPAIAGVVAEATDEEENAPNGSAERLRDRLPDDRHLLHRAPPRR